MQQILSLIFLLNVGAILAAPVVTNTTVIMQEISDLGESSRHYLNILHTQMTVNNSAQQQQIDTLRGTVDRLNDTVNVLSDWKATSEERLSSLENRVQENYNEFYPRIFEALNKARDLKDVIERYHPNSFHGDGDNTQTISQTAPTANADSPTVVVEEAPVE